jgi:hypothetical protein
MSERDGAWAARILARFSDADVEAAVGAGDFTDPKHTRFLVRTLVSRRDAVLRRYLARRSPLTDVTVRGDEVCATDLARTTGVLSGFRYQASPRMGAGPSGAVRVLAGGVVCVPLAHQSADAGAADDDVSRYVVFDVSDGAAEGPLRVHLYDLGPTRGFRLAGLERPPA